MNIQTVLQRLRSDQSVYYSLSEFEYQYYLDNTHPKNVFRVNLVFLHCIQIVKNIFSDSRNYNFTSVLCFQQYFNVKMITLICSGTRVNWYKMNTLLKHDIRNR